MTVRGPRTPGHRQFKVWTPESPKFRPPAGVRASDRATVGPSVASLAASLARARGRPPAAARVNLAGLFISAAVPSHHSMPGGRRSDRPTVGCESDRISKPRLTPGLNCRTEDRELSPRPGVTGSRVSTARGHPMIRTVRSGKELSLVTVAQIL